MYNDYYLQEINNKIGTTNSNLQTIITNQNTIITNQETINNNIIGVQIAVLLFVMFYFIVRAWKH